jgi:hypothetical protein
MGDNPKTDGKKPDQVDLADHAWHREMRAITLDFDFE